MARKPRFLEDVLVAVVILISLSNCCRGKVVASVGDTNNEGETKSSGEYDPDADAGSSVDFSINPMEQYESKKDLWGQNKVVASFPMSTWSRSQFPSLRDVVSAYKSRPSAFSPFVANIPKSVNYDLMDISEGLYQQKPLIIPAIQHVDHKRLPQLETQRGGGDGRVSTLGFDASSGKTGFGSGLGMRYNLRGYSGPGFSGRHTAGFLPRKRQILFRQCFFNPISCF